ncbi:antibiotic biosynthesis monooxygenase [Herbiconiux sp. CPCC 205763]|uniref:Antibiotic biosynthesis monooxygenase n=1 Tax=Herbiconiux aconitum TaxID=2970913 RepID=A0ABT2GL79_9MICO|nr:antibiotic biosynthesis monooxygenase family protein [Herbiconiux aconitum]MCS5716982.1 antibiotic biosynthesis monooxygenase [Herbiconiux aconitum]
MTVNSLLELTIAPEAVDGAVAHIDRVLEATRAFEGCLGVEVIVDVTDPAHIVLLEKWTTLERDDAYRAFRATPEGASDLGTILAGPPTLTRYLVVE